MAFIKVIEAFDKADDAVHAESALIASRITPAASIRIEPERLMEELHPLPPSNGLWDRIKLLFEDPPEIVPDHGHDRLFLIALVPEQELERARELLSSWPIGYR
jgi:hypothetical protein